VNERPAEPVAEAATREGSEPAAARLAAVARAGAEARPLAAGGRPVVLAMWVAERRLEAGVYRAGPAPAALSAAPAATAAQWSPRKVDAAGWSSAVAATGWAALHASPAERTDLDAVAVGGPAPGPVNAAAHVLGLILGAPVVVIQANVRAEAAAEAAEIGRGAAIADEPPRAPAPVLPLDVGGRRWPGNWRSWWARPLPTLVAAALVLAASFVLGGPRGDRDADDPRSAAGDSAGPSTATTDAATDALAASTTPGNGLPTVRPAAGPVATGSMPPDCPVQAAVFVCITAVTLSDGQLDIAYVSSRALAWPAQGQTTGFPVFHLEGTNPPTVLHPFEAAPPGVRRADGGGATPRADGRFDGRFGPGAGLGPDGPFRLTDVPDTARRVCVIVYLPIDTAAPGSGNCAALPGR